MLTDLIARAIAGQLKCSPECTGYPEGCGCAQNATAAVEKALADTGYVVVPKEPTEANKLVRMFNESEPPWMPRGTP